MLETKKGKKWGEPAFPAIPSTYPADGAEVKFTAISHHDRNVTVYQLVPVYQAQSQALCTHEGIQSLILGNGC